MEILSTALMTLLPLPTLAYRVPSHRTTSFLPPTLLFDSCTMLAHSY